MMDKVPRKITQKVQKAELPFLHSARQLNSKSIYDRVTILALGTTTHVG